jgi:hypothetical protein
MERNRIVQSLTDFSLGFKSARVTGDFYCIRKLAGGGGEDVVFVMLVFEGFAPKKKNKKT